MGGGGRASAVRTEPARVVASPPDAVHRPRLTAEELEHIRAWHDCWYDVMVEESRTERVADYLGLKLVIPPGVAGLTPVAHLLGDLVLSECRPGMRVLDLGCGTGSNALLAASRGASVLAVDTNPAAVAATADNAARQGLSELVDVRVSDGFDAVPERFDLVVVDPPLRWYPARDVVESSATDENYGLVRRVIAEARDHFTATGRMLFFFSAAGDLAYLRELFALHEYETEVVALGRLFRMSLGFDYLTYRVFG